MAKYELLPNEVVLLTEDAAFRGLNSSCELMLTNLNLVVTNRGVFGNSKSYDVFPVRQIKTHDGQAQALLTTKRNLPVLAVYFIHGEELFRFANGGASKVKTWAAKINEAVTGEPAAASPSRAHGAIGNALGIVKETIGAFKATPAPPPPVRVSAKCGSCGAPISGIRGQTTTCGYCDSVHQL